MLGHYHAFIIKSWLDIQVNDQLRGRQEVTFFFWKVAFEIGIPERGDGSSSVKKQGERTFGRKTKEESPLSVFENKREKRRQRNNWERHWGRTGFKTNKTFQQK